MSFIVRINMILYSKKDLIYSCVAVLILLIFGACSLTKGISYWGDDSAAYINEGIAIAEGRFQDQAEINYFYHPTDLPKEAIDSGSLVYVWGYPLIISLVYKLVGFSADTVIFYKLPHLLFLSLLAGALVLLFRKRLPILFSFLISVAFCMNYYMQSELNLLYSDLPFVFFCIITFLLMENICEMALRGRRVWGLGIIYGFVLWMTYETRLSGVTICVLALLEHILILFDDYRMNKKLRFSIFEHLFPYLLFVLLVLISEKIILLPATSNLSDLNVNVDRIKMFKYYLLLIYEYFDLLAGEGNIIYVLFILGIIKAGFKKQNAYFSILIIGTVIVNCNLPYVQGTRYIYNILPFMLMYAAYGVKVLVDLIKYALKRLYTNSKENSFVKKVYLAITHIYKPAIAILVVFVMIFTCSFGILNAYDNLINWGKIKNEDVFSTYAIEVYSYIRNKTDEDSVICFEKPRMLYLNTGHKAFRYNINGHELSEADYYLKYKSGFDGEHIVEEPNGRIVLENDMFVLYQL